MTLHRFETCRITCDGPGCHMTSCVRSSQAEAQVVIDEAGWTTEVVRLVGDEFIDRHLCPKCQRGGNRPHWWPKEDAT